MQNQNHPKRTINFTPTLEEALEAFLLERRSRNLSKLTIDYYYEKLNYIFKGLKQLSIRMVEDITPTQIRTYLVQMEERGHNEGGRMGHYCVLRAFLNWYEGEFEPESWQNPIKKVKAPKLSDDILPGVPFEVIDALLSQAKRTENPERDRAILLCLLDTGARASEFVMLNLGEINFLTGAVQINFGKGSKSRAVFLSKIRRKL